MRNPAEFRGLRAENFQRSLDRAGLGIVLQGSGLCSTGLSDVEVVHKREAFGVLL